jgi:anti-sigma regulatory factor (Ser/Thr protein kinase)
LPLSESKHDLDELPEGGMGLLLIEALMDEVEQGTTPQGNTVMRMIKRLSVDTRLEVGSIS